ncbi:hypothetical protein CAPTEDRAFT_192365 [Capitella teleta]|uniref:LRRCT domain-containing protein n=1 Tax=Capitella teleta TaxID=283909 RepID=R7UJP7_CAPTE|nr:hypothetical protein CAPTEDRAFT_192365 [Capitella teleta]|eukprot:ELU03467.1 hypothetical protein CAPTEDRAFT_192365 [Capitella teleta]
MDYCTKLVLFCACLLNFRNVSGVLEGEYEKQGLTSIPTDIDPDITNLNIWNNDLTSVQQSDFNDKYPYLIFIGLSKNEVSYIEDGCFRGTVLKTFSINNNQLTTISDFSEVKNTMEKLKMTNNLIAKISSDEISYLSNLNTLMLNENPLVQLPDVTKFLPSLTNLDIQNTNLECCCPMIWLKRKPDSLVVEMDSEPCFNPPKWTTTPWDQISEAMLLQQECEIASYDWIPNGFSAFSSTPFTRYVTRTSGAAH